MSDKHLAPVNRDAAAIMEAVIAKGDLAKLTPEERTKYYGVVCESLGLNPYTKPFDYLTLSGKTVLYAGRTATDQLRKINGVSIEILSREIVNGVYIVTAKATDKTGRVDTEIGAVTLEGLKGDAYANAIMKATTKAKRRATLSICGLGWLDETEVETIPGARVGEPAASVDVVVEPKAAPSAADLKRVKAELWEVAKAKGLDADLLNDYAAMTLGEPLANLAPSALADLKAKLAAEDKVDLLMRLTGELPSENPELFADVPYEVGDGADRYTSR